MFHEKLPADLGALLASRDSFRPHPRGCERERWESLPSGTRAELIRLGEDCVDKPEDELWPALTASLYAEFQRTGNRSRYEKRCFARRSALISLVLAECVEYKGRFLDAIVDGIWATCEESSWCIPAHNGFDSLIPSSILPNAAHPFIDLFAAETGATLSWIYYLLEDELASFSPLVPERIEREVESRLLAPFRLREDFL